MVLGQFSLSLYAISEKVQRINTKTNLKIPHVSIMLLEIK